jgi:hypothetical protein
MKIIIETQDELFAKEFVPQVLTDYVITNYRSLSAKKLNSYLESFNIKQSVRTILLYAIENLKVTKEDKTYILEVDKNKNVPNTVFSLDTIVNLITYGSATVKGYNLLLKAFEFISKKIVILKKTYIAKNKDKGEKNGN